MDQYAWNAIHETTTVYNNLVNEHEEMVKNYGENHQNCVAAENKLIGYALAINLMIANLEEEYKKN